MKGIYGIPAALVLAAHPLIMAEMVFAQASPTVVTGFQVQTTADGIQIDIETQSGSAPNFLPPSPNYRNVLVVDLLEAELSEGSLSQSNPAPGILSVNVDRRTDDSVRLTIIGSEQLPPVNVQATDPGVVVSLGESQVPVAVVATPMPTVDPTPIVSQPDQDPTPAPEVPDLELEEITVTADRPFAPSQSTTVTRTNTPLRDTPRSVQVVPRQVLEDQQINNLRDVVRNVSSVQQGNSFGNTGDRFIIRGFTQFNNLRNGLRVDAFPNGFSETSNLESVEVIKGPASILAGDLEPGGIINLVTKKPLAEPFYQLEARVGSRQLFRPSIDLSGPLTDDGNIRYRLNAMYETAESFRAFDQEIERYFISPSLEFRLGENTTFLFDAEYSNDTRPFDRGIIAKGGAVADIPREQILGEPDDVSEVVNFSIGYDLQHRFNDNLSIQNIFRYTLSDSFDYRAEALSLDEETGILERNFRSNDDYAENYAFQTNLNSEFLTGSISHNLLVGFDYLRSIYGGTQSRLPDGMTPSLDIFNPQYRTTPRPSLGELTNVDRDDFNTEDRYGFLVQDQIRFSDNLVGLIGGRYSTYSARFTDKQSSETFPQDDDSFSPSLGLLYQPTDELSIYGNFVRSFISTFATQEDGTPLGPEIGEQFELGARAELFDQRLTATLSAYQITKKNVATEDIENPDFSVPLGEVRSRGIDLDIVGEIMAGWNVIASYAFTEAEITQDNSGLEGNRLVGVPYQSTSFFSTYDLQSGNLEGLGFGLGVFWVGDRPGDNANSFTIDSFTRVDALVRYARDNWRATLSIQNLFDENYQLTGFSRFSNPGEPLTVLGSFSMEF
ncbi:MAG: TonB-dependent siderophore receptor [Synechococcaceae cyanobacterium SM2_3_2]|nr:TonB-dependent siderophore receptor [Synechococcaceae cyanobacterium SM2_3_2]